MILLSMDLSLSCPAFAVIKPINNKQIEVLHISSIKTNPKSTHGKRLTDIFNHMDSILKEYEVDTVIRERGFSRFQKATQTLFKVVGVSDLTAYNNGFEEIAEIPPTTVKKYISGSGKSSKDDVLKNIKTYINNIGDINIKNTDESDAIAVGIAYLKSIKLLDI